MNCEGPAGETTPLIRKLHELNERLKALQVDSLSLSHQSIANKVFAPGEAVAKFRGDVKDVFNTTLFLSLWAKVDQVAKSNGGCQPPPSFRMIPSGCLPVLCLQSATDVGLVPGLADAWKVVPKALRPAAQPIGHLDLKPLEKSEAFSCLLPASADLESVLRVESAQIQAAKEARQECMSNLTPPPEELVSSADHEGIGERVDQSQGSVRCALKEVKSPYVVAFGDFAVFVATLDNELLRLEVGLGQERLNWKDQSACD